MLRSQLIHPQILAALGRAGHGSRVLIADGNFPHSTRKGPNAEIVYLNFSPGKLGAAEVLEGLLTSIPIEAAQVMDYARTGAYALKNPPDIWADFKRLLSKSGEKIELEKVERFKFYELAEAKEVCLTIATGEQRIYANLLLTIGVVKGSVIQ
jgi:L-fucose mutarotase